MYFGGQTLNHLVVINYNSKNEVTTLLTKSKFKSLDITNLTVHCNGHQSTSDIFFQWQKLALERDVNLEIIHADNDGYGMAINEYLDKDLSCDYIFFSNADLWFEDAPQSVIGITTDIVGFGLWQKNKLLLTQISSRTPLIPLRFRKLFVKENKFGASEAVHGGFFGVKADFARQSKLRFNQTYFLYWDELWFCYEASQKYGASISVSDQIKVHHDGEKTGPEEDSRYYMLRNGLDFYFNQQSHYLNGIVLLSINLIYSILGAAKKWEVPYWFYDGLRDYLYNISGPRKKR